MFVCVFAAENAAVQSDINIKSASFFHVSLVERRFHFVGLMKYLKSCSASTCTRADSFQSLGLWALHPTAENVCRSIQIYMYLVRTVS